jgi:hypothetical protein
VKKRLLHEPNLELIFGQVCWSKERWKPFCVLIPIDDEIADLTAMDVTLKEIACRNYYKVRMSNGVCFKYTTINRQGSLKGYTTLLTFYMLVYVV